MVTQQALDDAVETIRKRTDALGVSEPEIQRSGRDQISVGLPDVQNAERAINQVPVEEARPAISSLPSPLKSPTRTSYQGALVLHWPHISLL